MPLLFSLLTIALMIFAIVDIILRVDGQVKHLPKLVWLLLVVLLPFIGSVLWFALGREYPERAVSRPPQFAPWAQEPPAPAPAPPRDPRSTEQQLADLEREIEAERLRAEIARRRAEQAPTAAGDDTRA